MVRLYSQWMRFSKGRETENNGGAIREVESNTKKITAHEENIILYESATTAPPRRSASGSSFGTLGGRVALAKPHVLSAC